MRTELLCISVLRVASGPRVKLAGSKSGLNPPVVYSTDHSKAVVPVLVLLFVALWFIHEAICFNVCLVLFYSCVFRSFEYYDYLAWGGESSLHFYLFCILLFVNLCLY